MPYVTATPEAIQALKEADLILFGPGSFLTSIMPPILLPEITEQLRQSEAKKIFIDNLGIEHSPASSLSLADRIQWINKTVGQPIIDGAIVPFNAVQNSQPMEIKILSGRLNADDISYRHDRALLCSAIDELLGELLESPEEEHSEPTSL